MKTDQNLPSLDELESLFINNEGLDRIGSHLSRFNPIRVMGMEGMEIRHSAILAWLLDPQETHNFGDLFLKAFLSEALRGYGELGEPTALEVTQSDLRDAEIRREWRNIDIFILSQSNGWAFIVENKFHSSQREGQLAGYIKTVKSAYEFQSDALEIRGIFLTLLDEEPQDANYAPLRYSAICEFLPRIMALRGRAISPDVEAFLGHYLDVIRDATGMSEERSELEALARRLYRSHKKVLDFVVEHGAGTDFVIAARTVFGERLEAGETVLVGPNPYSLNWHNNRQLSFLPGKWRDALAGSEGHWQECRGYWAGFPLICWFELFEGNDGVKGRLQLVAEVGPLENHDARKGLIDEIKAVAERAKLKNIRFQLGAADAGKRFSRFFKDNRVEISDIHDAEEIERAMRKLLKKFQPHFDAIAEILPNFVNLVAQESRP